MRWAKLGLLRHTSPAAAEGLRQNLGKMERLRVRKLADLLTATEAVCDDDGGWPGGLHGWKQALISDGFRHLKFVSFEAEGTGHAAATGLNGFNCSTGLAEKCDFAAWTTEDRLVMAVAVDENLSAF